MKNDSRAGKNASWYDITAAFSTLRPWSAQLLLSFQLLRCIYLQGYETCKEWNYCSSTQRDISKQILYISDPSFFCSGIVTSQVGEKQHSKRQHVLLRVWKQTLILDRMKHSNQSFIANHANIALWQDLCQWFAKENHCHCCCLPIQFTTHKI